MRTSTLPRRGCSRDTPLPRTNPNHTDILRRTQTIRKLGGVMLDMPDSDELVFELGNTRVPGETARLGFEVESVNGGVDHVVANAAKLQYLSSGIRLGQHGQRVVGGHGLPQPVRLLHVGLMFGPWLPRLEVRLKICVANKNRVIRDLPERIARPVIQPQVIPALLHGIAKHGQGRTDLTLENRPKAVGRFG